jgi:hypothetical protein
VTASGSQPLSYQWRKNTINISGATNSTYTIPAVTPGDAGNYSVIVTNSAGSATSNDAVLTVTPLINCQPQQSIHPVPEQLMQAEM